MYIAIVNSYLNSSLGEQDFKKIYITDPQTFERRCIFSETVLINKHKVM